MKDLNWFQAAAILLTGHAVRLDRWRKWLYFEHNLGWIWQPPLSGVDEYRRIALNSDFTASEFRDNTWTDEPWPDGPSGPVVDTGGAGCTCICTCDGGGGGGGGPRPGPGGGGPGGGGGTAGGGRNGRTIWDPIVSGGEGLIDGGSGGGNGVPGRLQPHNPPATNPAIVRVRYQTDLVPGGPDCLLDSQSGDGKTCLVIMTVEIVGGPPGVFGLHIQLGAQTKPAENGFNGYARDFAFTVLVNPGASLTPNVIYHPPGGDVIAAMPLFTFPPCCPDDDNLYSPNGTDTWTPNGTGEFGPP